jgi:dTDP-4-amino-4,6-dideoxygalactose transaminase
MIQLFHIEDYIVDTSKFDHALHDSGVQRFEEEFAEYVGAKYACSINSATSAIFLIFLQKNITIDVPSVIPPVVLNAIINGGNRIGFVDNVDWVGDSYTLHDFGDYKVIDSAQKVERGQFKKEASPQDLMFFSFYPTKPVGGLDGGMIVSDDYDKIMHFKEAVLNGMSYASNNWERSIKFPGWKMYLNSFQTYVAHQNFLKLPAKMSKLEEVREFYNDRLGYKNTSSHLYRITVEDNKSALVHMREKGVVCGIHYEAAHQNKVYNKEIIHCPDSTLAAKTTLSIPFNEKLTKNEINHIIDCVREIQ